MIDPRYVRNTVDPRLSPEQLMLLIRIAEEASEVIKAACKAIRFGFTATDPHTQIEYNNKSDILAEFNDLRNVVQSLENIT